MKKIKPLHYKQLRKSLKAADLKFETTDQISESVDFLGQQRALEAINLGLGIKSQGYNFFVMGPSGIGKRSLIRTILKQYAQQQPQPEDWCYIYNFHSPEKPIAIKLPAGHGKVFKQYMEDLVEDVKTSVLSVCESEEYQSGIQRIHDEFIKKRSLKSKRKEVDTICLHKEKHKAEIALQSRLTDALITPFMSQLKNVFAKYPGIVSYLGAVHNDILTHASELVIKDKKSEMLIVDNDNPAFIRYQVNLLVSNDGRKGLPIIIEDNPTYYNLISRSDHKMQNGILITDFTLLRSGALHRANGGFLIIEARKLFKNKLAWNSLKNALYTSRIMIDHDDNITNSSRSVSLKPKSIPLKIKIVLLGDRNFYYKLSRIDPDFNELFKVAVDLDDLIDRNKKNITIFSHLIGTLIKKRRLRPFDRTAVAAVIDYSARLADDTKKLSNHTNRIDEIIREANYWAKNARKKTVDAACVKRAIESKIHRMDRSRDLYYEDIQRDFILIKTKSFEIGQLNCLSVVRAGNFSYGHPTRVTASVRPGKGEMIDIQREIRMAGAMHSKAGLILTNYLAGQYSPHQLFSLHASISFEQIYGMIDGDSASVAELCTLISAIAQVPLNQSFALTGSVNQLGEVQAVGGVNEKIEGFYDVCNALGLTGKQGVIIPASNVQNLMLREDVVSSVKAGQFSIYTIKTVGDAIYLLTGIPAGNRSKKTGAFPAKSVNAKVEARLNEFAMLRRSTSPKNRP